MGGGLLELVTIGEMDKKYFLGNPEISFFKYIYKKHTNFALETKRMYFENELDFGKKTTVKINKLGDLISNIFLEIELPPLIANDNQTVSYVNSVGNVLIKKIDLEIGGEIIVTHTGEWLEIWNQLSTTSEKKKSYNRMVGKYGFLDSNTDPEGGKYIIPLDFWFCKEESASFPLMALQFHDIKLHFELRPFNELWVSSDGNPPKGTYNLNPDSYLYVDYVFLDREERTLLAKMNHDILIKQLQIQEFSVRANKSNIKLELNFYHPILELIWVIQREDVSVTGPELGNDWFNYSSSLTIPHGEPMINAKLLFNGMERFDELSSKYFRLLEPYKKHTSVPDNFIYCYSFALKPESNQPTGSCNFGKIDNVDLFLTLVNNLPNCKVKVFAINHNILTLSSGMAGLRYTN